MVELDHLSYSSISGWQMCPRAWKFRRIDNVPSKTGPALIFGSAFHNAVEQRIRHNVAGRAIPLVACWANAWKEQIERNTGNIDWGDKTASEMDTLAQRMLATPTIRNVIDSIRPLMVQPNTWDTMPSYENDELHPVIEQLVELNIEGIDIPLIGYIDVIGNDGIPCDFKTAGRKWNQDKADKETQCTLYIAALEAMGYTGNPNREFRYYVFTKTSRPIAQVLTTDRTQKQIDWAMEAARDVYDAIKKGAFPPASSSSWKCGPRWCGFYSHCHETP